MRGASACRVGIQFLPWLFVSFIPYFSKSNISYVRFYMFVRFISFVKNSVKSVRTKGRSVSVISISAQGQFQKSQAQYTCKQICSHLY